MSEVNQESSNETTQQASPIPKYQAWVESFQAAARSKIENITFGPFNEKKDEIVLCFPAERVKEAIAQHGDEIGSSIAVMCQISQFAELRPRGYLENNQDYIHAISYFALRQGDKVYVYSRGKVGGEDKLFDRASIGFGGHSCIEDVLFGSYEESFDVPEDMSQEEFDAKRASLSSKNSINVTETMMNTFKREFLEEVDIASFTGDKRTDGLSISMNVRAIWCDTDADNGVHRVHLGLLSIIDIPEHVDGAVVIPKQNEGLGWFPIAQSTIDAFPKMELWSKIFMQYLIEGTTYAMSVEAAEEARLYNFERAEASIEQQEAMAKQYAEMLNVNVDGLDEIVDSDVLENVVGTDVEFLNEEPTDDEAAEAELQDSEVELSNEAPEGEEVYAFDADASDERRAAINSFVTLAQQHAYGRLVVDMGTDIYFKVTIEDQMEDIRALASTLNFPITEDKMTGFTHVTVTTPRGLMIAVRGPKGHDGPEYNVVYNLLAKHGYTLETSHKTLERTVIVTTPTEEENKELTDALADADILAFVAAEDGIYAGVVFELDLTYPLPAQG